jgi:hypothetical protein
MVRSLLKTLLFACLCTTVQAQIIVGADTLYGNEWIDHSRTYYRFKVAEDGIYRIDYQALTAAGLPTATTPGVQWRIYREGRQVPLYVTTDGVFGTSDYIEFWGERNRSSVDQHLFDNPQAELTNPWYSMFSDSSAYYIIWETNTTPLRYLTINNNLNNPPPPDAYCWQTDVQAFNSGFTKRKVSNEVTYSWFNGEGWHRGEITNTILQIPATQLFAAGPPVTVRTRFMSDLGPHQAQLWLHDSLYNEEEFFGWRIIDTTCSVPAARFSPTLKLELRGLASGNDRHGLAAVVTRYPRQFNFEGAAIAQIEPIIAQNGNLLEINNFNVQNNTAPVCYDLNNRQRLVTQLNGNQARMFWPQIAQPRQLALVHPTAGVKTITAIKPIQFRDYRTDKEVNYIFISHPKLMSDPTENGKNHVQEYADYRASAEGGSYKTTVVDINDLYEQFGYGVRFHPLAVRNFFHFVKRYWDNPQYVLMAGKGLDYANFRPEATQQVLADSLFYVPMYGTPAVDQSFLMRKGGISTPFMSIGRLAAVKPHQIGDYLRKVKEHETSQREAPQNLAARAWMKRAIHISGGGSGEAAIIRANTEDMSNILRTNRFGGDISTFFKTSNDPIQNSAYEQINGLLEEGVGMWMIYGHSSATAVDFDIGAAGLHQTSPRYPYMMIMGCFSGTCSMTQRSLGEDYVFSPGSGSIAFSASTNYSFIDGLHTYGRRFYERVGGDDYGKTIGKITQNTINSLEGNNYSSLVAILHQNVLQGDPALRLSVAEGPDYVVDDQSVAFDPNPISTESQQYKLTFDIANIGENKSVPLAVRVEQRQPNNTLKTIISDTITAPALRQRLTYDLSNANNQVGFHRFLFKVDPANTVPEWPSAAELNNDLRDASGEPGVPVYFYSADVQPIYPPNYGIVADKKVTLSASTLSSGVSQTRFLLEFDNVETFNSALLQRREVTQAGGLIQWQPDLELQDSTVYYWRIARDSLVNGAVPWRTQSFVHIKDSKPGWNQSNYGQYMTNALFNLQGIDATRDVEFINNAAYMIIKVGYRGQNLTPGLYNVFFEGAAGDFGFNNANIQRGVLLMYNDPATGRAVVNPAGGPYNPAPATQRFVYLFNTADSLHRIGLMEFIKNQIPQNSAVGILAFNRADDQLGYDPENWAKDSITYGKNLFQVFEEQGARRIRELAQYTDVPVPYGLVFRKDDPNFNAIDTIVTAQFTIGEIRRDYPARWFAGQWESPAIGPVVKWEHLYFSPEAGDNPSDEANITVLGIRPEPQTDTVLFTLRGARDTTLAWLDPTVFKQLRLRYNVLDTTSARTATPLRYVRITYQPLPEGALNPTAYFDFFADTIEQGQNFRANIAFANVSDVKFDSIRVDFRLDGAGSNRTISQRLAPLAEGDSLHAGINISTLGMFGPQRLLIDVNPAEDQPEQFHFNNVLFREFYVGRDRRNPLLDVTFDGQHLMDGDLVSPKPIVVVSLKDDNPYLALSDTALLDVTLIWPDGTAHRLSFSDPNMVFIPANPNQLPEKNRAQIEWRPTFTQDGTYQLRVQGRDASGNESGSIDYTVTFEVITKSSLSHLLNYPNPFSTSTCFIYTLTGAETPTHFNVQIMTVSGRVVREVTAAEFGPLLPGRHQSNFCWDGRDDFGDQLANGVYLYRIVARKADGTPFELFENQSVDGFFKGGFGKMVLMR